jgi:hypothetical protein
MFREGERTLSLGGEVEDVVGLLATGLEAYEGHIPILERMMDLDGGEDSVGMAFKEIAERHRFLTQPDLPAPVKFPPGVELEGVTLQAEPAAPEGEFLLVYYWTVPENFLPGRYMVFVHFMKDGIRFQDDHQLLGDIHPGSVKFQPFEEMFREERLIKVPADAPPGEYTIALGLLKEGKDERYSVETELPASKGKVVLPVTLHVAED